MHTVAAGAAKQNLDEGKSYQQKSLSKALPTDYVIITNRVYYGDSVVTANRTALYTADET